MEIIGEGNSGIGTPTAFHVRGLRNIHVTKGRVMQRNRLLAVVVHDSAITCAEAGSTRITGLDTDCKRQVSYENLKTEEDTGTNDELVVLVRNAVSIRCILVLNQIETDRHLCSQVYIKDVLGVKVVRTSRQETGVVHIRCGFLPISTIGSQLVGVPLQANWKPRRPSQLSVK